MRLASTMALKCGCAAGIPRAGYNSRRYAGSLKMRELSLLVLEMERQGKRLHGLLRVGRLNTMTWAEFRDMVTIV